MGIVSSTLEVAQFSIACVSDEEVSQMTFQVVLVGRDGMIVGSDRKMFTQAPHLAGDDPVFTQFEEQSKFVANEDESVICACSGVQEVQRIARKIVLELDPKLSPVGWLAALDALSKQPQFCQSAQLIVVRKSHPDYAAWLVAGRHGFVSRIEEKQCVGVATTASFLPANFSRKCSVNDLKTLALLTLDYGATEFPTSVGRNYDLLILRCGSNKAEWDRYEASDGRVEEMRRLFEKGVESALYAGSSSIVQM
jgi:hypothetical protein